MTKACYSREEREAFSKRLADDFRTNYTSHHVIAYYIGATKSWIGMARNPEDAKIRAHCEIKYHWPEIGRMTAATVKVINHDETA